MSTSRSVSSYESGVSMNASLSPSVHMERDLLERMVQARDEKITTLQKTVNIQKEHTSKLQQTLNDSRLKLKRDQMRSKMECDSITNERNVALMELRALVEDRKKYKDVVFTLNPEVPAPSHPANAKYLSSDASGDDHQQNNSPRSVTTMLDDSGDRLSFRSSREQRPPTPARMESAHALYLQAQLYEAMNSVSALQIKTMSLKKNCEAVVKSLEEDLTETTTLKHQVEVELMSQITHIEREKSIMEGQLREEMRCKDIRMRKLEAKIRSLEGLEDGGDSDDSDDEEYGLSVRGESTMSLATVDEGENSVGSDYSKDVGENDGDVQIGTLLDELERKSETDIGRLRVV